MPESTPPQSPARLHDHVGQEEKIRALKAQIIDPPADDIDPRDDDLDWFPNGEPTTLPEEFFLPEDYDDILFDVTAEPIAFEAGEPVDHVTFVEVCLLLEASCSLPPEAFSEVATSTVGSSEPVETSALSETPAEKLLREIFTGISDPTLQEEG